MTELEIEGNKLIADFMGLKSYQFNSLAGSDYMVYELGDGTIVRHSDADWRLKYDISWDWIMPVVFNIKKSHELYREYEIIEGALCRLEIEAVWLAVIEFIKSHKTNKS